jgi:hypothetical protein
MDCSIESLEEVNWSRAGGSGQRRFFVDWDWQLEFSMAEARLTTTRVRQGRMFSLSAMAIPLEVRCCQGADWLQRQESSHPLESLSGHTTRKRLLSISPSVLFLICRRRSKCVVCFIIYQDIVKILIVIMIWGEETTNRAEERREAARNWFLDQRGKERRIEIGE